MLKFILIIVATCIIVNSTFYQSYAEIVDSRTANLICETRAATDIVNTIDVPDNIFAKNIAHYMGAALFLTMMFMG